MLPHIRLGSKKFHSMSQHGDATKPSADCPKWLGAIVRSLCRRIHAVTVCFLWWPLELRWVDNLIYVININKIVLIIQVFKMFSTNNASIVQVSPKSLTGKTLSIIQNNFRKDSGAFALLVARYQTQSFWVAPAPPKKKENPLHSRKFATLRWSSQVVFFP